MKIHAVLTSVALAVALLTGCQRDATIAVSTEPTPTPVGVPVCYKTYDLFLGQTFEEVSMALGKKPRVFFESTHYPFDGNIEEYWLMENETLGIPGKEEFGSIPSIWLTFTDGKLSRLSASYILAPENDDQTRFECLRYLAENFHRCLSESEIEAIATKGNWKVENPTYAQSFAYDKTEEGGLGAHLNYEISTVVNP